jgi:hypothetical protein
MPGAGAVHHIKSGLMQRSKKRPVGRSSVLPKPISQPRECRIGVEQGEPFTLVAITSPLSCCLKFTSFKVLSLDGTKTTITGGRLNMGMRHITEIFNRRFNDSAQRSASNECVRLIRKLRWIGMDDEAERVLAQLSGWPFRPTETVIAGPWATD